MGKRKDWAIEQARRVVDLTQGLSRDVCVTYVASELRLAHSRGAIETAKTKTAEKLV